jgi:lysosomal alpha-mannosidase
MTVLNDRAQGGSSIKNGTIELMQNRRVYTDDYKGLERGLDETNQYGYGIFVPATYYVEIFEFNKTLSNQRARQLAVD